jgi:V8-like Glu-specific endopeptidase
MGLGGLVRNVVLGAGTLAASVGLGLSAYYTLESEFDDSYEKIPINNVVEMIFNIEDDDQYYESGCRGIAQGDDIITAKHCVDDPIKDNKINVKFHDGYSVCDIKKISNSESLDISKITCEYVYSKKFGKHDESRGQGLLGYSKVNQGDNVYYCVDDLKYILDLVNSTRGFFEKRFYKKEINDFTCFKGEVLKVDTDEIFTSFSSRQGYSGSPLFDSKGNLVGITSVGEGTYKSIGGVGFSDKVYFVPIQNIEDVE